MALRFSTETCSWSCLGNYQERQLSQERQDILAILAENSPLKPHEIAKELGKNPVNIRALLTLMYKDHLVSRDKGQYRLPDSETHSA
jgi:predicted transcriptional regulator